MATTTSTELSDRGRAVLRAVRAGRCELSGGSMPDLFVDGLPFCDPLTTHALTSAGLVRSRHPVTLRSRTQAELTLLGEEVIR
ncbi:hypothetical protein SAMN05192558_101251 [Actinokineospora alba]|uniref:Uncharacterized protein n=1 Tax=Actinokineospora alba TaxID=504798 RepID=A0A1H0F6K6_9PSEU|nr:hypothetical protein [Actinokineospora alba]TDP69361.1 hypothetical protein C8E96_4947 [Actinokineospora alba]SDI18401.1 hypothetical protein SAMN05421871_103619 [Actinokineospora alba]SDN90278.1 hypothetical protein SAMN05192558_101251 [Actinokineospora alba]